MNKKVLCDDIQKILSYEIERIFNIHECVVVNYEFYQDCIVKITFETAPHKELAKIINNFKTVSSRSLRKKHSHLLTDNNKQFWSQDYFIFTDTAIDFNDLLENIYQKVV